MSLNTVQCQMQYEGHGGYDGNILGECKQYMLCQHSMKAMMAMMTMMVMMQTKCTSYSARCSMKAMVVMMAILWVNVSKVVLAQNEGYDGYDNNDGYVAHKCIAGSV